MKICITGIVGFVGSHVAEFYAKQGYEVIGIDNFSRSRLLGSNVADNSEYLIKYPNITIYNMDLRNYKNILSLFKSNPNIDVVIHCAAQTAVTKSITNPKEDFENNVIGSFNLLEAIRESGQKPILLHCSTNKVYGDNINYIPLIEKDTRYKINEDFFDEGFSEFGITEEFLIDHTSHTPYGVSKLSADLYFQEYAHQYGFKVGVFRCSCLYGTRQMGVEDQGWISHFIYSALKDLTINIFGDGKQVRDVLYVSDLVEVFDLFIKSNLQHEVFNIGGGQENTLSLLELIEILELKLNKDIQLQFHEWRSSDQKVYISDISKAQKLLNWKPKISPIEGIEKVLKDLFSDEFLSYFTF
jgi:CDP-paratose 2-epimerase